MNSSQSLNQQQIPLSDRMRPESLSDFVGQESVVGKKSILGKLLEQKTFRSCIFWGPPGVGKTTLAQIVSRLVNAHFVSVSAVSSGKADLMKVVVEAEERRYRGEQTLLFVDEIHRWSKTQQDALLPYVEKGVVLLIGATTENPSFEIIGALLSRAQVIIFSPLSEKDIVQVIDRALTNKEHGLGAFDIKIAEEVKMVIAQLAGGDVRQALNILELAFLSQPKKTKTPGVITRDEVLLAAQKTHLVFDKNGEEFYNTISALHKSLRGSDANASLYWLARMLEGGADPLYIARRLVRFASEDVGMANGEALIQANAVYDACHKIGMPECSVHLAQAVVYLARSKKSNLLYTAYKQAAEDARSTSHMGVPLHLRNAPTKLMKSIGYGKGYKYNPDFDGAVEQDYLPPELKGRDYLQK